MRPAARLQAAIEILDEVEEGIRTLGAPADVVVANYCRNRRFIGSKDRRAITGLTYDVIRCRGLHSWRLSVAGLELSGRGLLLSHLARTDPESLELFGDPAPHSPDTLAVGEKAMIARLPADEQGALFSATHEVPDCVEEGLRARFSDRFDDAMSALNTAAPLDIRSNLNRPEKNIINHLKNIDEDIEKTGYSPIGYRSRNKVNISGDELYRRGAIEVQDEAAQLACYLTAAASGMSVIDLCAGAGGKSLLISALMDNKGQVYSFDISGKRLNALKSRAQRAGCRNVQSSVLPSSADQRAKVLAGLTGKADRVVVDTPCTGTGTWRRNPDQRWRLSAEVITGFSDTQNSLLTEGANLVKVGGRLVYMTCSVLPEENEVVVERFLNAQPDGWRPLDYKTVWLDVLPGSPPETLSKNRHFLQLVPHMHQTDGFFIAILEKTSF